LLKLGAPLINEHLLFGRGLAIITNEAGELATEFLFNIPADTVIDLVTLIGQDHGNKNTNKNSNRNGCHSTKQILDCPPKDTGGGWLVGLGFCDHIFYRDSTSK